MPFLDTLLPTGLAIRFASAERLAFSGSCFPYILGYFSPSSKTSFRTNFKSLSNSLSACFSSFLICSLASLDNFALASLKEIPSFLANLLARVDMCSTLSFFGVEGVFVGFVTFFVPLAFLTFFLTVFVVFFGSFFCSDFVVGTFTSFSTVLVVTFLSASGFLDFKSEYSFFITESNLSFCIVKPFVLFSAFCKKDLPLGLIFDWSILWYISFDVIMFYLYKFFYI